MVYRNKTYVAFDGDNDIKYYNLMKAWKQSDNSNFNFYDAHELNNARDTSRPESIKRQLSKRMENSKVFVLLLGENTKYLTRFVKWEVEHALYLGLPIIVVNLNGNRNVDKERMPSWLKNELSLSCSFNQRILQYSLENWEYYHNSYKKDYVKRNESYMWGQEIYYNLGL